MADPFWFWTFSTFDLLSEKEINRSINLIKSGHSHDRTHVCCLFTFLAKLFQKERCQIKIGKKFFLLNTLRILGQILSKNEITF